MMLPPLLTAACGPQVPNIVERFGKRYTPLAVPKGLPRYRTLFQCHRNSALAAFHDRRLTYVEGLARCPATGRLIGHAWVTMDGEHAIDLTWRGQTFRHEGYDYIMDPPAEYYGVEIPTRELARLVGAQRAFGLVLDQYITAEAA
jgi:hypothetical protein